MKILSGIMMLAALITTTGTAEAARVVKLGQTRLDHRMDADFIRIANCNGRAWKRFDRLQLVVRQNAADIDFLAVRYGNGAVDRLEIREHFRQGSASRWIDLRGGERCIEAVAIVGDSRGPGPKAVVQLFGLDN